MNMLRYRLYIRLGEGGIIKHHSFQFTYVRELWHVNCHSSAISSRQSMDLFLSVNDPRASLSLSSSFQAPPTAGACSEFTSPVHHSLFAAVEDYRLQTRLTGTSMWLVRCGCFSVDGPGSQHRRPQPYPEPHRRGPFSMVKVAYPSTHSYEALTGPWRSLKIARHSPCTSCACTGLRPGPGITVVSDNTDLWYEADDDDDEPWQAYLDFCRCGHDVYTHTANESQLGHAEFMRRVQLGIKIDENLQVPLTIHLFAEIQLNYHRILVVCLISRTQTKKSTVCGSRCSDSYPRLLLYPHFLRSAFVPLPVAELLLHGFLKVLRALIHRL